MWTSSIRASTLLPAVLTLIVFAAGCASKPGLEGGDGGESKYAEQRKGGAASDSDAMHVPPVPHDPSIEGRAEKALPEYVKALQAMRAEEYQKALVMLQSLSSRFPALSGPLVNQGIAYMELEQYEDAEDALRQALEVNDRNPYAHNSLGVVLREQGRFEEARQHYQTALQLDPKYARAHFNMGVLAELYLDNLNLALQHFRAYQNLQKEPDQNVANWIVDLERRAPDPQPAPTETATDKSGPAGENAGDSGSGSAEEAS
jgi:Flp pilus assembly protein TadD